MICRLLMETAAAPERENGREFRLLSVVAPMLNEADTVETFYGRVRDALDGLSWELVAVDDGSTDETVRLLRGISESDPRVRVVCLARNFGHQAALTAGLDHASGDVVVTMDADLQDPPELIEELLARWREGAEVVHAVRDTRAGEPRWRLALIRSFYRLFGRFADVDSIGNSGDFRLLDRRAVDVLARMPERNRYLRGMSVWLGFNQATVVYDRDARYAGETKYPLTKLMQLAIDGILSFSVVPLRIAAVAGLFVSAVALLAIPVVVGFRIAGEYVPGIASVTIVLLLLGGFQLLTLGIIGEYIGRSYEEAKRRPIYVIGARWNFDAEDAPEPLVAGLPAVPPSWR
jgi:dolichol-phosphate mannosyltransferase